MDNNKLKNIIKGYKITHQSNQITNNRVHKQGKPMLSKYGVLEEGRCKPNWETGGKTRPLGC